MSTRERAADRGSRHWTRTRHDIGAELRDARLAAGLTQRAVSRSARISQMEASRIERGVSRRLPAETLFRIASVLGLRVSVKAYPEGPPLRDAAHTALLARFRTRTHPSLRWQYEVPVTDDPTDRRAWDAEMTSDSVLVRVEAEIRLYDAQALERRLALKIRDAPPGRVVLLIRGSAANRRMLSGSAASLQEAFPLRTRQNLAALAAGEDRGGNAIVLL